VVIAWRRDPSVEHLPVSALPHRTMVRALGVLYIIGGTLALVWTTLPHGPDANDRMVAAMGLLAVVFGGLLAIGAADRLPPRSLHAILCLIQIVIFVAYISDGRPDSDMRLFFIWSTPYAAFYFRGREAATHMAWTALLLLVSLVVMAPGTHSRAPAVFIMTMGTVLATGVLVGWAARTLRYAEAAQRHQALHDSVTGLPNRLLLSDRIDQALARAHRAAGQVVVVFLDVDQFKLVNDCMGHAAGDALLVQLGLRLKSVVRRSDTLARFGGDEFVIVYDDVLPSEVERLGDRITNAMKTPFDLQGREMFVTVSTGIVVATDGDVAETLLRNADAAMYRAKERGRNGSVVFDKAMHRQAAARLDSEAGLRHAQARGELRLHFQPILDIVTEKPVGLEALVRWEHPERGLVFPSDFIPVAEESGLIVPIGEWVLTEALGQAQDWRTRVPGAEDLFVAINLSARQLLAPDLLHVVAGAIDAAAIPAAAVHLEITESVVMNDVERSVKTLAALRSLGVRLAVDDFGTGYSSLSYLKRLPVNTLKIDRSFIDGLGGQDPHDPSIVHAIISLARALDLDVIAEGVETPAQLTELRHLGAGLAQGYLWSKPLPPEEVTRWLTPQTALASR
jgi:diguanylate cyclase (GGDEF)-like protein